MLKQVDVSIVFFRIQGEDLQVLLTLVDGKHTLPSLSLLDKEPLLSAVNRLAANLLNTSDLHLQQMHTYGESGQAVQVVYLGITVPGANPGGATACTWQSVDSSITQVPGIGVIIKTALQVLRQHGVEGDLVPFFLPVEFTLGELQRVWQVILDEKLDKRNFRRRILASGLIKPTSRQRSGQGRPARLHRFRDGREARHDTP